MRKLGKPIVTIKVNADGMTAWKNGKTEKPSAVKQDLASFRATLPKRSN